MISLTMLQSLSKGCQPVTSNDTGSHQKQQINQNPKQINSQTYVNYNGYQTGSPTNLTIQKFGVSPQTANQTKIKDQQFQQLQHLNQHPTQQKVSNQLSNAQSPVLSPKSKLLFQQLPLNEQQNWDQQILQTQKYNLKKKRQKSGDKLSSENNKNYSQVGSPRNQSSQIQKLLSQQNIHQAYIGEKQSNMSQRNFQGLDPLVYHKTQNQQIQSNQEYINSRTKASQPLSQYFSTQNQSQTPNSLYKASNLLMSARDRSPLSALNKFSTISSQNPLFQQNTSRNAAVQSSQYLEMKQFQSPQSLQQNLAQYLSIKQEFGKINRYCQY